MNDESNKSTDENKSDTAAAAASDANKLHDANHREVADAQTEPPAQRSGETSTPQPTAKPKKSWRFVGVLLILVLGLLGISGGLAYFTYNGWQKAQEATLAQQATLAELEQSIGQVQAKNQSLQDSLRTAQNAAQGKQASLASRLQVAEQRIIAQNKRLKSMSSTSRDDWLLAEAEYLLKLANQRVLIEREAGSAEGLLEEADAILRDMVDPDLFPLRKAISSDLAALRLSKSIDVEGLYLAVLALAEQIEVLPTRPEPSLNDAIEDSGDNAALPQAEVSADRWWSVPLASFDRFAAAFRQQIKITPHESSGRPVVLMQPQTHLYLQQNLRMQLERAQLALLREQQKIYSESLSQAAQWVETYFPRSEQARTFVDELQNLSAATVVKQLPDISGSWELLNTYIQDLHDLKGQKVPAKQVLQQAKRQQQADEPMPEQAAEQGIEQAAEQGIEQGVEQGIEQGAEQ